MPPKFRIAALTTSRADFSIYKSVFEALAQKQSLDLGLIVTGSHLSRAFGKTIDEIRESPWPIVFEFPSIEEFDTAEAIGRSMGRATTGMASAIAEVCPDLLLVLGDRYEMLAASLAAVPAKVPIAHIHGGEETEGAMDNVFRHALTKISHLHYCATPLAKQRIIQMGEPPQCVIQSGAPAIDSILKAELLSKEALALRLGITAEKPFLLVTYHPVTLDLGASQQELDALFSALSECDLQIVFTGANADTSGREINAKIEQFVDHRTDAVLVQHLGSQAYYSAMSHASAMVGNSSSGIIEAASFGLPVINIGSRQQGRERSKNTIDVTGNHKEILSAIQLAQSESFLAEIQSVSNVYGNGTAGVTIAESLDTWLRAGISATKSFQLI